MPPDARGGGSGRDGIRGISGSVVAPTFGYTTVEADGDGRGVAACRGACGGVEAFCVEPAVDVQAVQWQYVGKGQGKYSTVQSYNFVGEGCGSYEQEVVTSEYGWKVRPLCICGVAVALGLAAVFLMTLPGTTSQAVLTAAQNMTAVSASDCDQATGASAEKAAACCRAWRKLCPVPPPQVAQAAAPVQAQPPPGATPPLSQAPATPALPQPPAALLRAPMALPAPQAPTAPPVPQATTAPPVPQAPIAPPVPQALAVSQPTAPVAVPQPPAAPPPPVVAQQSPPLQQVSMSPPQAVQAQAAVIAPPTVPSAAQGAPEIPPPVAQAQAPVFVPPAAITAPTAPPTLAAPVAAVQAPTTLRVGNCLVWGDPHILTFDGSRADFLGQGEAWIVRNEKISIQGRYTPTPFTNGLAATSAIAIGGPFLMGHVLKIGALEGGQILWDNQIICGGFPSTFEYPGFAIISYNDQGNLVDTAMNNIPRHIVHVSLPLGVHLQVMRWSHHINVRITMPQQVGGQDGQCGNFNLDPRDDTTVQITGRIGLSVGPSDLLFGTYVPPKAANRLTLQDCSPQNLTMAQQQCLKMRPGLAGEALNTCMFDVCFAGPQYAAQDTMY